jgi:hypothetical protein
MLSVVARVCVLSTYGTKYTLGRSIWMTQSKLRKGAWAVNPASDECQQVTPSNSRRHF